MPPSRKETVIDTERKSRIQQALSEANLDAVICALPSDVLLLTGYWPVIGASVAICFREGPTILLVPEDEKELAEDGFADSIVTFTAETLEEMQSITDAVKPLLTARFNVFMPVAGHRQSNREAVRRRLRTLRFIFSGTILRTSFAKRFPTRR